MTEWLSQLSWTQTVAKRALAAVSSAALEAAAQGKGSGREGASIVCQQSRIDPGWERDRTIRGRL